MRRAAPQTDEPALRRYRDKRDFDATPEPRGRRAPGAEVLSFVIQRHAARRLHYDFRLELDGTLKSWAVPKGPSLDPAEKRMAVEVEDHPLDYAGFEGTIPAGHYGAGEVIVWDRGWWEPVGDAREGLAQGKLKFVLHGHKLQGAWTLVRIKPRDGERQQAWLLIKERDAHTRPEAEYSVVQAQPDSVLGGRAAPRRAAARASSKAGAAGPAARGARRPSAAPLPKTLAPALATLVDQPPREGDWVYEIKFDGYRLLARAERGRVRLLTRNGLDWTERMPALARALAALELDRAWLDGEIVVLGADGTPDFQALQNAFDGSRTEALQYFVFDLPFHAGEDLRPLPLAERRERLRTLLAGVAPPLRFSEAFGQGEGDAARLLESACALGLEGLIGKRADSAYPAGRSKAWIKLKCQRRQEFVIGGYTDPQGSRSGLGSLLLGVHDEQGRLRYAGNVGTGFDSATLDRLRRELAPLEQAASPFTTRPAGKGVHWLRPERIAEVAFAAWTGEGRVRHAVFKGLRDDKPARAIARERPLPVAQAEGAGAPGQAAPRGLRITHPERVVDASTGITKGEVVAYFDRVAEFMLPLIAERPVALVRAPDGIAGGLFFQKHVEGRRQAGLTTLDPALDPGQAPLLHLPDRASLLAAAQLNVLEVHAWNARARAIEQPDRIVFDLDPGEGVRWGEIVEGAMLVHALLDELGLRSFLKTSGGKGLHVVVPLAPRHDWDSVKGFSRAVVQHLAAVAGGRFVAVSGPKNRVGRIFVDYLRNGRGATTAAAFSPRARPGLAISLPLAWEELPSLAGSQVASVRSPPQRLAEAASAWAGIGRARQSLDKAMKRLAAAA